MDKKYVKTFHIWAYIWNQDYAHFWGIFRMIEWMSEMNTENTTIYVQVWRIF